MQIQVYVSLLVVSLSDKFCEGHAQFGPQGPAGAYNLQNPVVTTEAAVEQTTKYILPEGRYGDLTKFLSIAGAKPSPVVRGGGYSGRRKRQVTRQNSFSFEQQVEEFGPQGPAGAYNLQNTVVTTEAAVEQTTKYILPKGRYGDLTKFLSIAGAKPSPVVRGGGYSGRRKRQVTRQNNFSVKQEVGHFGLLGPAGAYNLQNTVVTTEAAVEQTTKYTLPEGRYGDLTKFLAIAGAKPSPVVRGGGYSGRRKREDNRDILTNEIPQQLPQVKVVEEHKKESNMPLASVKVKTRGNYGLRSFLEEAAKLNDEEFRGRYSIGYGRTKRQVEQQDFIPFSEYETRKVGTLKIEQNDFLALDQRLRLAKRIPIDIVPGTISQSKSVRKRNFLLSNGKTE